MADLPRIIPPSASALIDSLRGVGYSLETAIADLVDNSLTAGATTVEIDFDWNDGTPRVMILDDGNGMSSDQLVEALRFGGCGPDVERHGDDLGRFGLGLKTASLSQCRLLTVGSKRLEGNTAAFRWDLDHIKTVSRNWELRIGWSADGDVLAKRLDARPKGTLVLWESVDFGRREDRVSHAGFMEDLERVERHLAMVFHRFISGDARRVRILVNNRSVKAWDPFLEAHEATRRRPEQFLNCLSGRVAVRGFVLPHRDRFKSEKDYLEAGGPLGWNAQQGFYIYRNKRLLSAGGWLGLGGSRAWTREEASKLGRIRIDIPNSADSDWNIDVKKSIARPPSTLRPRLSDIAQDVRKIARDVFVHRGSYGTRPRSIDVERIWDSTTDRDITRYRIKRDHPAVAAIRPTEGNAAAAFDAMLLLIERSVPVDRIWLDVAEKPSALQRSTDIDDDLTRAAVAITATLIRNGIARAEAIQKVAKLDPYDSVVGFAERLSSFIPGDA